MKSNFNIIIPSIRLSAELLFTLKKLESLKYKNFFVTIVLNKKNFVKILKFNYPLKIIFTKKQNMSTKRNIAVRKFNSKYTAFLDSDAYPNKNWLNIANKLLKKNKADVVGGPNIPFLKQNKTEMLCHYAKRSFYLTGYLNFRKFKSKSRYCDWLESCNFLMLRSTYLKFGGMNEELFLGEDKNFFEKCNKKNNNFRTFYTPNLFIFHKERGIKKFLLQRFAFGLDIFNIMNFNNKLKSFQPLLPVFVFINFLYLLFIDIKTNYNLPFSLILFLIVQLLIFLDVKKYLSDFKKIFLTISLINIANIFFVFGNLFKLTLLDKLIVKKSYRTSRNNL